MTHKKHKMKPLVKLAVVALLFFSAAPLHAFESTQTLGFTEQGKGTLFIKKYDLPAVIAGGGAMTFSLDLHFGTNDQPVLGIMSLIHYNSKKIEVIGISNIAHAGFGKPRQSRFHRYISNHKPKVPLPDITIAEKSEAADTDTASLLAWMDLNKIRAVAEATIASPVRIITIHFRWKAGATGNSYLGITQYKSGTAHVFNAMNIIVRGPAEAKVTARPASIDVTANDTVRLRVRCVLSRPSRDNKKETFCTLAHNDAETFASTIRPPINGATIIVLPGETSGSRRFDITPSPADNGRVIRIALRSAVAGDMSFVRNAKLAEIPLRSPGLLIFEKGLPAPELKITTKEGEKAQKFTVTLATPPAGGNVVVDVLSNDPSEAEVAPPSLTFTESNWSKRQRVFVTGVDDKFVDGDKPYTIAIAVDNDKTAATRYHNIIKFMRGETADNDEAKLVLTAQPNKKLKASEQEQRIVITATLEGGGVFDSDTLIALSKAGGSADEGVDYEQFTLPEPITIPADAASASAAFAITILKADTKSIVITGKSADTKTRVAGITLLLGKFTLDVDSDGHSNARDGIMIARYFLGVRGDALTAGQSNTAPGIVADYIEACIDVLDVSGDDTDAPDSIDGTLIARYLLGLRGDDLVKELEDIRPDVAERKIKELLQP